MLACAAGSLACVFLFFFVWRGQSKAHTSTYVVLERNIIFSMVPLTVSGEGRQMERSVVLPFCLLPVLFPTSFCLCRATFHACLHSVGWYVHLCIPLFIARHRNFVALRVVFRFTAACIGFHCVSSLRCMPHCIPFCVFSTFGQLFTRSLWRS